MGAGGLLSVPIFFKQHKMAKYLTPEKLNKDYQDSLKDNKCNNELLKDFRLIAENSIRILNNGNESHIDKDACINYAVTEAWIKWKSYDPKKTTNIFSFYTTMILNDMRVHYNYLNRWNGRCISMTLFENSEEDA